MKKIILMALCILAMQRLNSQNTLIGNKFIIGGSINFLSQNNTYPSSGLFIISRPGVIFSNSTKDSKNSSFAITPYFGKEISEKLVVIVHLDYRLSRYKAYDVEVFGQNDLIDFERNSNQIGIGISTRYVINPKNRFNFFIQPYVRYSLSNEEELQDLKVTQEEKVSYFEVGAGLGLLYNIDEKLRATLRTGGLNYTNGKWEIKGTNVEKKFSSFGSDINLSTIFFGVEFRI